MSYFALKGTLAEHGIRVEFATEPIDASASGELMETMLAGMARFENRQRVERTIGVEKILTKEGYWCRAAPTGFRNGRNKDGKPILLPTDEPGQWDLLRYGLRKQLSGSFTVAEVALEVRKQGLRTCRGNLLGEQTWTNICRSPLYGGLLHGVWTEGQYIRAKFDGPLTPEEWLALQDVLDGRKRVAASLPRKALHPDFPLRRFLRCPACRQGSRGYSAMGRTGRTYAYYDCGNRVCKFRVRTADAHEEFADLLRRVTPAEPLLVAFRAVALQVWADVVGDPDGRRQAERGSITRLEEEKGRLVTLMKRAADNTDLLAELEKDFARVQGELSLAQVAAGASAFDRYDPDAVADACVRGLGRTSELWLEWPLEAKSRIQRLVFPNGVPYDVMSGNRNPELSLLYALIPASKGRNSNMAPPHDADYEPIIATMIAWYEVFKGLLQADETGG